MRIYGRLDCPASLLDIARHDIADGQQAEGGKT
jgi:hypothetical protein